jgi:hypothetical protein
MSSILNTISNTAMQAVIHPVGGLVSAYQSTQQSNRFDDTSSGMIAFVIIILIAAIVLWIMSLFATFRLTNSSFQVILCLLFGSLYLFLAWIYYGFTNHKFAKVK